MRNKSFAGQCAALLVCSCFGVFVLYAEGCRPAKSSADTSSFGVVVEDSLLVSLKRGACFGACPQFECAVYKTGLAVYEGERNVKKQGVWKARLSSAQLDNFRALIRTWNMEEKDTVYINKYLADYPAFFLAVSDKKPVKRIYVNHDQPPVELTSFVTELEKALELLDWKNLEGVKKDE